MASLVRARSALLALTLLAAPRATISAQHEAHGSAPLDSTAVRFGRVSFANSGARAAQPAFLRGLALLHNFEYADAATAFREAQTRDPGFAMAYWGEAMTYNHGVWREQDSVKARAVLAPTRRNARPIASPRPRPQREKDYLANARHSLLRPRHQGRPRLGVRDR